jgi:hypothetical protein
MVRSPISASKIQAVTAPAADRPTVRLFALLLSHYMPFLQYYYYSGNMLAAPEWIDRRVGPGETSRAMRAGVPGEASPRQGRDKSPRNWDAYDLDRAGVHDLRRRPLEEEEVE